MYNAINERCPTGAPLKKRLTERFIKSLQNPQKPLEVYDTEETGFCLVARPSGVKSFCVRYRNADGRKRTYTIGKWGKVTVKQARDLAKKLNGQISNGVDIQTEKKEKKARAESARQQTLKVFFEERYKPYCLAEMKRGKERLQTIEHYFVNDWGDKALTDINEWLITNWRRKQLKRGLKPGGVNRPVSALKAMLNRAVDWGVIENNPIGRVKLLKEDPSAIIRYLDDSEDTALRKALADRQEEQRAERKRYNQWLSERHLDPLPVLSGEYTDYLKPMVLLALNTGMRRGEIFDLRLKDIDFKRRQIVVHGHSSKSGKTRYIPLTNEGVNVLTTWCNQNGFSNNDLVFASPVTGGRFDNINNSWRELIKRAGIEHFRFHDLRHTYASRLVMRGADLYVVRELLGHASIETTQRYSHLAPEHKTRTVELLDA